MHWLKVEREFYNLDSVTKIAYSLQSDKDVTVYIYYAGSGTPQQLKGEDFAMLAVNIEENGPEVVPGFLKQNPHSFPVLFDTERKVQDLYGVDKFPETFVIGKNGKVQDHIIGAREWSHPDMVNYFKDLIRGN